jgi:nucleotide-binding universal stress UspA family protein
MSRSAAFRSILVPVDGSPLAEAAIPYALAIAERAHSKLRFALVYPSQFPPLLIDDVTIYVRKLTERFRERLGPSLSSIVLNGPVAPSLSTHAKDIGADLVVMSTHGWGGLRRVWLGSVADQLIRTSEVPVMVVRPREDAPLRPFDLREILLPLDGSLLAEVALYPAIRLAQLWGAQISLLQVVQPVWETDPSLAVTLPPDEELTARRKLAAEDYLKAVVARLGARGARLSGAAVVGTMGVTQTLLELAKPERIGVMAMATHGRGGFRRQVLGSVTDRIVRTAEMPVLVVPHSWTARRIAKLQRRMVKRSGPELSWV